MRKIFFMLAIGLIILLFGVLVPLTNSKDDINFDQAGRIAKWKIEFENLKYSFSLVNLHEGSILPTFDEAGKIYDKSFILNRIKPYFDVVDINETLLEKYKYSKMSGKRVTKDSELYFTDFFQTKNGMLLAIKENVIDNDDTFVMFVDINGFENPNKIGQDIFFIEVDRNSVEALGYGLSKMALKTDCSPIGSGVYCSSYYLLGGSF